MKNSKILKLVSIIFFIGAVFVTFNASAAFEKEIISQDKVQAYWWDSAKDSSEEKPHYWWTGQNNIKSESDKVSNSIEYWWNNYSSSSKNIQCYWWLNGPENYYCQA